MDFDAAAAFQGFQAFDDGGQFHAVVGGLGFAAEEFFLVPAVAQQRTPAACAGIAFACAVGVEVYGFVGGFLHHVFGLSDGLLSIRQQVRPYNPAAVTA